MSFIINRPRDVQPGAKESLETVDNEQMEHWEENEHTSLQNKDTLTRVEIKRASEEVRAISVQNSNII